MVFRNYCMDENDEITDVEVMQLLDNTRNALEAYNTYGSITISEMNFKDISKYKIDAIARMMITDSSFYIHVDSTRELNMFIKDDVIMYVILDNMIFKLNRGQIVEWLHFYCNSGLSDEQIEELDIAIDGISFGADIDNNFNKVINILDQLDYSEVKGES